MASRQNGNRFYIDDDVRNSFLKVHIMLQMSTVWQFYYGTKISAIIVQSNKIIICLPVEGLLLLVPSECRIVLIIPRLRKTEL